MRILVTGGAGFIGSNLIHHLLGEGHGVPVEKVVNLDKLTYAGNPANLEGVEDDPRYAFVRGDICDAALLAETLEEHRIDRVVHLAAESHVDRSIDGPESFVRTNVLGTFTLLEAFRRHRGPGAEEGRVAFLHVSTDEVFGALEPDDPPFDEATPFAPSNPYSASKAGSDHLVRAWFRTYGLPVATVHCSNNYGPRQFPEKLIPLMIRKLMKGAPLPLYGDGRHIRDWLYVRDHCRGLLAVLSKGKPGETYALGGGCEMRNIDLAGELAAAFRELAPGSTGERIVFVGDRPGHDRRYAIDAAKARRELGWEPEESFRSGIRKTVRWYLENEEWIREIENGTYRGERLGVLDT